MYEITLDDGISFPFKDSVILDFEGFFILLAFIFGDDLFWYGTIIHYHIVELSWVDIALDRIDKVYDFHIGRLSTFGHCITDIDDFCIRLIEGFTHTFREEIGHYTRIEIARTDDDVVSFEDGFPC
jgi:hypothetical protein